MKKHSQIFIFSILKTFTAEFFVMLPFIFVSIQSTAQTADDFSDGNFSDNPAWNGNADKFIVSSGILKLQAPATDDVAYLSTASNVLQQTTWAFTLRLDFNPSGSNYARIYLASDQPGLSSSLNGYFVMVGGTQDEISLYRQSGMILTRIIDGADGHVNLSTFTVRVKVTRDASGNWQLFSDVGSTGTDLLEGSTQDNTHPNSGFLGIYCAYTATRSDKFFFDDLLVTGASVPDTEAPALLSVNVISEQEIDLVFSESLDPQSSDNPDHYVVDNGLAHPSSAILRNDGKTVHLVFGENFPSGTPCTITVSGIKDIAGNLMTTTIRNFLFFESVPSERYDIIITEIFADPSPRQELPEAEFVELFNKSTHAFDLANWKLSDGSTTSVLPDVLLLPNEYLVIVPASSSPEFSAFGKVVGLSGFPSLNNSGDMIVLRNEEGQTIDSVRYTSAWYRDQDKDDGGWSLELIDPYNPCSGDANWTASEDERGGTPAKQNSVFANKPDLTGPVLIAAFPVSPDTVKLVFNEKLEDVIPASENFSMNPDVMPVQVIFGDAGLTEIHVVVDPPLAPGILYSAEVRNIRDCNGNPMEGIARMEFGLPQIADSLDVVINEVLFNPRPGGVDFVEIVNASRKFINLKDWSIATMDEAMIKDLKPLTTQDLLIQPGSYHVLTENGAILKGEYLSAREETFVQTMLPALNDDESTVVILDSRGKVIDLFNYTDDMHAIFIKDEEGVSLERITFDEPTNDSRNWKSASSHAGFATPGYLNSNATPALSVVDGLVQVSPEIFVPVHGQPDFTQIRYRFDHGGFVANIRIYDAKGHLVKHVANNELLGTEGFFRWDGDKDDGTKARMGYYMVWVELFDAGGEVRTIRRKVAVAAR